MTRKWVVGVLSRRGWGGARWLRGEGPSSVVRLSACPAAVRSPDTSSLRLNDGRALFKVPRRPQPSQGPPLPLCPRPVDDPRRPGWPEGAPSTPSLSAEHPLGPFPSLPFPLPKSPLASLITTRRWPPLRQQEQHSTHWDPSGIGNHFGGIREQSRAEPGLPRVPAEPEVGERKGRGPRPESAP